jgi:AP-3 complex subunit sigma
MGGMVLETSMSEIVSRVEEMSKLEKAEAGITAAPAKAMSAVKEMNIPSLTQKIKDIKMPDLPSIGGLKFN